MVVEFQLNEEYRVFEANKETPGYVIATDEGGALANAIGTEIAEYDDELQKLSVPGLGHENLVIGYNTDSIALPFLEQSVARVYAIIMSLLNLRFCGVSERPVFSSATPNYPSCRSASYETAFNAGCKVHTLILPLEAVVMLPTEAERPEDGADSRPMAEVHVYDAIERLFEELKVERKTYLPELTDSVIVRRVPTKPGDAYLLGLLVPEYLNTVDVAIDIGLFIKTIRKKYELPGYFAKVWSGDFVALARPSGDRIW